LITITTGDAAQFMKFWYDVSPRPMAKTMIIRNTANQATKMQLSSRNANKKYVRFFNHHSLETGWRYVVGALTGRPGEEGTL
jgi:hypothetical protein